MAQAVYALPRDTVKCFRESPEHSVYLIHKQGAVVASDTKAALSAKAKDPFLDICKLQTTELACLGRALLSENFNSLLFMADARPVIAWPQFYGRTSLFALWLPEGEVRRCLSAPAAYADILAARHVAMSHGALARYLPQDEFLYPPTDLWLRDLELPLFYQPPSAEPQYDQNGKLLIEANGLIDLLAGRTLALAHLVGINLDYDWTGLGFGHFPYPDLSLITANLLTLFLVTRRAAVDATLTLHASREECEGAVIEAQLTLQDPSDPLPELSPLMKNATLYGDLFTKTVSPNSSAKILIKFSIFRKELSVQGVKAPLPFYN